MSDPISQVEDYDLLVLGSGEGGKYLAWTLGKQGQKVAVVEKKWIGGACPNMACLPSKNLIHSAKVASYFYRSAEFGISKENSRIDMAAVRERKRLMVSGLVDVHVANYKASGAELVMGWGTFVAPKTIEVALNAGGTRTLRGRKVVLDTGSRAKLDPIPGLEEAAPLTHIELLEIDHIPDHLIVLGGGYIGLEFAQAMRRFGSKVTIIERNDRLAHREDLDISAGLLELFEAEGVDVITTAHVTRIQGKSGETVLLHIFHAGAEIVLQGTHLLVASGRTPNTQNIGLNVAGIALTPSGHVQVNARLETTAPDVLAIGDCNGGPHFTHVSFDDFRIVRDNLAGGDRVTTGRVVPFTLFTDPEFARIGLSETEAQAQGIPYRFAKIPMAANLRTRTLSETRGFMKALVATDSDRILGFTCFGVGAGEILGSVQVAMIAGLPYTALRDAIFTHPTLLEGLIGLFTAIPPRAS